LHLGELYMNPIPDDRDTIPSPPPSHVELADPVVPPRFPPKEFDDSEIFAFAFDLDED
jgi:hypothetical protein